MPIEYNSLKYCSERAELLELLKSLVEHIERVGCTNPRSHYLTFDVEHSNYLDCVYCKYQQAYIDLQAAISNFGWNLFSATEGEQFHISYLDGEI